MWCFFDESYPTDTALTSVVACLMRNEAVAKLDQILYQARKKHLGTAHAKDLHREIKGQQLLSANSFRMAKKHKHSCNHQVAKDILSECAALTGEYQIRVFAAAVYGEKDILKRVNQAKLTAPIVHMLRTISGVRRR